MTIQQMGRRMMNQTDFKHISVLLDETIEGLDIKPDGIYVDGTMGGAGHGYEVCKRLGPNGRYIGIDRDEAAIAAGKQRLSEFENKVSIVRGNYSSAPEILKELNIDKVDGIMLDLGVSSHQLDVAERGFSYMADAPLDMRMDKRQERTAYDIVNGYSERELARIIREYGEDKFAQNIAKHIVAMRQEKPIETTGELNEAIRAAIPMKIQKTLGHPSKRTFQAIRIELNEELEELRTALESMIDLLKPGGRFCIITFHSLEDRMVKTMFKQEESPCTCPPEFPVCVCGKKPRVKIITKKPILPSETEQEINSRARSAKLRVLERI